MTAKSARSRRKAMKWVAEAEADKRLHEPWQRDFYRYCLPHRRRPGDTMLQPVHDQDELFDSIAIEMLADFAADMQSRFTPPAKDWLTVGVSRRCRFSSRAKSKSSSPLSGERLWRNPALEL
jgi:hypothetical protein